VRGLHERLAARLGQIAHPQNIAVTLGHRDDAARIEKVEDVAGLDGLVVGGQHAFVQVIVGPLVGRARGEQRQAFLFGVLKMAHQHGGVGIFEIVP